MTLPMMHIPNPLVLGSELAHTLLYWPHAESEVPVVVGFDIDGFKALAIKSVHVDYGRGEWGPDILAELDELQVADLATAVCLTLAWDGRGCRDERNQAGYAPRPWLV